MQQFLWQASCCGRKMDEDLKIVKEEFLLSSSWIDWMSSARSCLFDGFTEEAFSSCPILRNTRSSSSLKFKLEYHVNDPSKLSFQYECNFILPSPKLMYKHEIIRNFMFRSNEIREETPVSVKPKYILLFHTWWAINEREFI